MNRFIRYFLILTCLTALFACTSPTTSGNSSSKESTTIDSTVVTLDSIPTNLAPGSTWNLTGTIRSPKLIDIATTSLQITYKGGGGMPHDSLLRTELTFSPTYIPKKSLTIGTLESGADVAITIICGNSCKQTEYQLQYVFSGDNDIDNCFTQFKLITTATIPKVTFVLNPLPAKLKKDTTYKITGTITSTPALKVQSFSGNVKTADNGYVNHNTAISGILEINNVYQDPLSTFILGNAYAGDHFSAYLTIRPTCPSGKYKFQFSVQDIENRTSEFETFTHDIPFTVE